MAEGIFKITSPEDPERCQGIRGPEGQCINKRYPGSNFCLTCGGNRAGQEKARQSLRNYKLDKFRARLLLFGNSPDIKSLKNEIAILRMTLEERLNTCQDATDLVLMSNPISDLVMKIERLVSSAHKLEGSMGQLLDKQSILQFANRVIQIIGTTLAGQEELMSQIADEILCAVSEIGSDK